MMEVQPVQPAKSSTPSEIRRQERRRKILENAESRMDRVKNVEKR